MREPLSHLDDCAGIHYRLQLNVYCWMLETYYDAHVTAMFVVCTHPDNGGRALVDHVPRMREETSRAGTRVGGTHKFISLEFQLHHCRSLLE